MTVETPMIVDPVTADLSSLSPGECFAVPALDSRVGLKSGRATSDPAVSAVTWLDDAYDQELNGAVQVYRLPTAHVAY